MQNTNRKTKLTHIYKIAAALLCVAFMTMLFAMPGIKTTGAIQTNDIIVLTPEVAQTVTQNAPAPAVQTAHRQLGATLLTAQGTFDGYENGVSWTQLTGLNVFNNPDFQNAPVIAPGVDGTYFFTIKNGMNFSVDYVLTLSDDLAELPLEIRLKKGEAYLLGGADEWVDLSQARQTTSSLLHNAGDELSLDWRWNLYKDAEGDIVDTLLGKAAAGETVEYNLTFHLSVVQTGEEIKPPFTLDGTNAGLLAALVVPSFLLLIFLVWKRRREEDEEDVS